METEEEEKLRAKFEKVCDSELITIDFIENCTSAIAMLARTTATIQVINEVFYALCDASDYKLSEEKAEDIARKMVNCLDGLPSEHVIRILLRLTAAKMFIEYAERTRDIKDLH